MAEKVQKAEEQLTLRKYCTRVQGQQHMLKIKLIPQILLTSAFIQNEGPHYSL